MECTDKTAFIRAEMKKALSEKRYAHVCAVCDTSLMIADCLGIIGKEREELACGALLHDITREESVPSQLAMCEKYGIKTTDDDLRSPFTLHAKTGAARARELYPDIADDAVCGMILKHCTGEAGMTVREKIVFLSDYIEPTRKYPSCIAVREYYNNGKIKENPILHLDKSVILAYDYIIGNMREKDSFIHPATLRGRADVYDKLTDI